MGYLGDFYDFTVCERLQFQDQKTANLEDMVQQLNSHFAKNTRAEANQQRIYNPAGILSNLIWTFNVSIYVIRVVIFKLIIYHPGSEIYTRFEAMRKMYLAIGKSSTSSGHQYQSTIYALLILCPSKL